MYIHRYTCKEGSLGLLFAVGETPCSSVEGFNTFVFRLGQRAGSQALEGASKPLWGDWTGKRWACLKSCCSAGHDGSYGQVSDPSDAVCHPCYGGKGHLLHRVSHWRNDMYKLRPTQGLGHGGHFVNVGVCPVFSSTPWSCHRNKGAGRHSLQSV